MERRSWGEVVGKEGGCGVDLVQWGALGVEGRRAGGGEGRRPAGRRVEKVTEEIEMESWVCLIL
jgi:hypothetical protein